MNRKYLFLSLLGVLALAGCATQNTPQPTEDENKQTENEDETKTPTTTEEEDETSDPKPSAEEDVYLPEDVLKKIQGEVGFHAPSVKRDMFLVYTNGEWKPEITMTCYDDFYVSYKENAYVKDFVEYFDDKTTHTPEDLEEGLGDRYLWYVEKGEDNRPYITFGDVNIMNQLVFEEALCRLGTDQHMYFDDLFENPFNTVSRYNFVKDEEGHYVCNSTAIANNIVNSLYFYETMAFTAESVYIDVAQDGGITLHASTERSVSEGSMITNAFNYKYEADFTLTEYKSANLDENLYKETEDNKKLGEALDKFEAMDFVKISIESSQEGWDGQEYLLVREDNKMPYLYPLGMEVGYYEDQTDDNIIHWFNVVDGVAVGGDMYLYSQPEGQYYFVDIEAISANFQGVAHEVYELVVDQGGNYYQTIDRGLRKSSAEELAPNPEFKFDFESITSINRIFLEEDGSMRIYNKFTDMSSGTPTPYEYTITYSEGSAEDITFDTSLFNVAAATE